MTRRDISGLERLAAPGVITSSELGRYWELYDQALEEYLETWSPGADPNELVRRRAPKVAREWATASVLHSRSEPPETSDPPPGPAPEV